MRILTVHNYYQQGGGEDEIFKTEADLLESRGHSVYRYTVHNDRLKHEHPLASATNTLWNRQSYDELRTLMRQQQPDIAHFHNTFPLISPAAYYAAQAEGVPVVQTLHNFRLLCPNGLFFRQGKVCEDCLGKSIPLPGLIHGCYRGSRAASGVVTAMISLHSSMRTWLNMVDVFIAYSHFALEKFVEGGIPAHKLEFKTNFLHPDPGVGKGQGNYGLFVGRLSTEKGIGVMLDAWEQLNGKIPLKIVGDGPLADRVQEAAARVPGVDWLGRKPLAEVYPLMENAKFLVFPSEWYETFGRVAIEAYAKGTPVIGAKIGAISELIDHQRTGLHFRVGDARDLAAQVNWLLDHPQEYDRMRQEARAYYLAKHTATDNYQRLMEIYALAQSRSSANQQALIKARPA